MTKRTRRPKGFTLVEVLVVVIVIGLIASAAGTYGYSSFKRMQLRKAARELYLALKYARVAAIENQQECRMLIDKESHSYVLVLGSPELMENADDLQRAQGEDSTLQAISNPYVKPTELGDGIDIEDVTVTSLWTESEGLMEQNQIVFRPDGTADAAVVQLGNGKYSYTLYLMAGTAKAKIEEGTAEELPVGIVDLDEQGEF